MRHSLFFSTCEEADQAESYIKLDLDDDLTDIYQTNDGDSRSIEVRFFTENKLSNQTRRYVIKATKPDAYAVNGQD